ISRACEAIASPCAGSILSLLISFSVSQRTSFRDVADSLSITRDLLIVSSPLLVFVLGSFGRLEINPIHAGLHFVFDVAQNEHCFAEFPELTFGEVLPVILFFPRPIFRLTAIFNMKMHS